MNHLFQNNDFDPSKLFSSQDQSVGQRMLRGRWTGVSAFRSVKAREAHLRGVAGCGPMWAIDFSNGITDVGIHFVLDRFSNVGAPSALTWYAGLMDNAGFTGVASADTALSHTGWSESVAYDESVRQTLAFSAASARAISDSVSFTMNATTTVKGLFVISDNTKSGTAGTLFSTALFVTPPALVSGNVLTANYSLSD